jgi:methyl-accepting chemotaxis protein
MRNLPIVGKFVILLVGIGIAMVAMAGFSAVRVIDIDSGHRRLNETQGLAATALTRGNGALQTARASIAGLLVSVTLEGNEAAIADLKAARLVFQTSMKTAAVASGAEAPRVEALLSRGLDVIDRLCKHAIDLGEKATQPPELLESQAVFIRECDPSMSAVSTDVQAVSTQRQATFAAAGAHLAKTAHAMLITTAIILASLIVGLMVAGIFAVRSWIVSPIKNLLLAMRCLSEGNLAAEIAGGDRRDEIGAMARAVLVFKANGLKTLNLETEAADRRNSAEAERARVAAADTHTAEQQAVAVKAIATGMEHLAEGDLAFRLNDVLGTEYYERLRTDFNGAMAALQEAMLAVVGNADAIGTGSTEITQASDNLSKRTEQQAASLEETAAALDQITATVGKTATGANHARTVATTAKADAEQSGEIMNDAVQAMEEIEQSARGVTEIIGVIDEIAFQTNLLALNAGVEAARAGDAGRGFAVVASEVRMLAQRSATAAKEIKALIQTSGEQVQRGVKLVGTTGTALSRIVGQVSEIHDIIADIAASAQEQATALQQVNTAVNQMDQVTQQNAAMVEQSTAASHSLAKEAGELVRMTQRFGLGRAAAPQRAVTKLATASPKPANRPQGNTMMKVVSSGSAAVRTPEPSQEGWEEF